MDPRSQAEWDLAMAEFRKAIGQEREEDSLYHRLRSFYGAGGALSIAPVVRPTHQQWQQHLTYVTPSQVRTIMGMPMYFPTPSPWDRLKGMVVELRTRLALAIGGEKVVRSDDCY